MKSVTLFVFNSFTNDSRVLKTAQTLSKCYRVDIVAHGDDVLPIQETVSRVALHRFSRLNRKKRPSLLRKITAYLIYLTKAIAHARRSDFLHCNDLNTLPIGYIIKTFFNRDAKIIYDAHEYETEVNNLNGYKKYFIRKLEKNLIAHIDVLITVSHSIEKEYRRLYHISHSAVVFNTPPYVATPQQNLFRTRFGIDTQTPIFLYQGGLDSGRGIEEIADAFKNIQNSAVVFMGYGSLESKIKAYAKETKNIFFHPAVSPDILLEYTASADFGIALIEDSCLSFRYCLPNKLFEYIMAGLPVLVSDLPEMAHLVQNHGIGIVSRGNDRQELERAIEKLQNLDRNHFRKNLSAVQKQYCWEQQEKVLLKIYQDF